MFAIVLLVGQAMAAENVPTLDQSTAASLKSLSSDYGLWGTLLALALSAIGVLFWLLMKSNTAREVALSSQQMEHERQINDREVQHAKDRNDWYAAQQIQQENRVALLREVMTALAASTSALQSFQNTVSERTQTAGELQARMGEMVVALQAIRTAIGDDVSANRKTLSSLLDEIEKIRRRMDRPA